MMATHIDKASIFALKIIFGKFTISRILLVGMDDLSLVNRLLRLISSLVIP